VATVVLPRSLVALFPGSIRRVEVRGATVLDVVDALDERIPGVRDRLLDAGPVIRPHLNVFVDGARAGLDAPVGPASVVHVIPAVSGG
jgi:molybdopterin converting factor small subunit